MGDSTSEVPASPPPVVEPPRPSHPPDPPQAPPASGRGRYLLTELLIVTAGVLIALSVDSFREWSQNRALVAEARQNIVAEISANIGNLESTLKASDTLQAQVEIALTLANDLLKTKKSTIRSMELRSSALGLSDTSWRSAERTGALAHMSLDDVERYSGLYEFQALFASYQRRLLDGVTHILSTIDGDPYEASPKDLERMRERTLEVRADLYVLKDLGRQLVDAYKKALER